MEKETDPNHFLVEYSKQGMLYHVCENGGLGMPSWSLCESRVIEGVIHYQFAVTLSCGPRGRIMAFQGKYARTPDLARESVSWIAVNSLCVLFKKRIRDFNFYHVKDLEEALRKKDRQIACRDVEIELLEKEIGRLQQNPYRDSTTSEGDCKIAKKPNIKC